MAKRLSVWAIVTAAVLALPLVAMRFTSEVNWSAGDFVFAAVLIFGTGALFELARTMAAGNTAYKIAAGLALLGVFMLVWVNGAVGIIGDSDVNMFYALVAFVLFIGSVASRFKPYGMSLTLYAAALVQFLIPVVAFVVNMPDFSPGVVQVFLLNGVWVMTFVASGLLFAQSAQEHVAVKSGT